MSTGTIGVSRHMSVGFWSLETTPSSSLCSPLVSSGSELGLVVTEKVTSFEYDLACVSGSLDNASALPWDFPGRC